MNTEDKINIISNVLSLIHRTEQMVQMHGNDNLMGQQYAYKKMRLAEKLENLLNEFGLKATVETNLPRPKKKEKANTNF